MKRMYYLTSSLSSVEKISDNLHQAGITDWNFHVHSNDEAGLIKHQVHSANYIQKMDIVRYSERGGILGFTISLLACGYIMTAQPFGGNVDSLGYMAVFTFFTLFGAWAGGMVGMMKENQKLAQFHDDIEAGRHLLLVDVKAGQAEDVRQLMAAKHPEARFMREGSTLINPFKFAQPAH